MEGLTSAGVSTPKSEVEKQFVFCDEIRKELEGSIQLLESRLLPILRSDKQLDDSESTKEEELTLLANSIRKIGKDMLFFQRKIRSILERLEI